MSVHQGNALPFLADVVFPLEDDEFPVLYGDRAVCALLSRRRPVGEHDALHCRTGTIPVSLLQLSLLVHT